MKTHPSAEIERRFPIPAVRRSPVEQQSCRVGGGPLSATRARPPAGRRRVGLDGADGLRRLRRAVAAARTALVARSELGWTAAGRSAATDRREWRGADWE